MQQVTIICKSKKRVRKYSSWKAAMDAIRAYVVVDSMERELAVFLFGK